MIMLGEKPWVKYEEESPSYGKFIVEPLERGYGATLGNSLRRILLAHLQGAAITSIRIEDVSHEFTTIPNVVEDVLEIILNLKEVVLRSYSDVPKVITLKAKGPGEIKAGDIEHDAEIEVANPDHKIATLETGGKFSMEMIVERGKGFVAAERNKKSTLPVGYIPIDSVFTPIKKVNVVTEEMRVGQEIKYDRMVLHVWTNGSMKPDEAVRESSRILSRHIDLFLHLGEQADATPGDGERGVEVESGVLDMSLDDLELSARSLNCLKNANIKTVRELVSFSTDELMKFKNFGTKSLNEVREKLLEYKLSLKGEGERPVRHNLKLKKLGRPTDQRMAMLYDEASALIKYGKIKLTLTRAKAVKPIVEKLVSMAKKGDVFSRRKAFAQLKDRTLVKTLFDLSPRFEGRPGGFTRITPIGFRKGDAAPLALLEFV